MTSPRPMKTPPHRSPATPCCAAARAWRSATTVLSTACKPPARASWSWRN